MIFTLDVGSTTQDFLLYVGDNLKNCPKAVFPSPTKIIARKIASLNEDVFLYGYTMGGGAITRAVKDHIKKSFKVYATQKAALTFNDNLDEVRKMGIIVTDHAEAVKIKTCDVDLEFYKGILENISYEMPEKFAVAVQDHGFSPFESNRTFRFKLFKKVIEKEKFLEKLLFNKKDLPKEFNRMSSIIESIEDNMKAEVFVTDTSFAAIAGYAAFADLPALVVNFGNSHVTAAIIDKDWELKAILEHHTNILRERGKEYMQKLLERFLKGEVTNEEIVADNGHGCYIKEVADVKDKVSGGPAEFLKLKEIKFDQMIIGNIGMLNMLSRNGLAEFSI